MEFILWAKKREENELKEKRRRKKKWEKARKKEWERWDRESVSMWWEWEKEKKRMAEFILWAVAVYRADIRFLWLALHRKR